MDLISMGDRPRRTCRGNLTNLFFVSACFLFFACNSYPQSGALRCKVSIADFNKDNVSTIDVFSVATNKQSYLIKHFPFTTTGLYINAAVFLDGEGGSDEIDRPKELYLILALSTKPYKRIELEMKKDDVISNAMANTRLRALDEISVSTTFLGRPDPVIVTLECKKQ